MKDEKTLSSQVLQWCVDHPYELGMGTESVYKERGVEAFNALDNKRKRQTIRQYITINYLDKIRDRVPFDFNDLIQSHKVKQTSKKGKTSDEDEDVKTVLPATDPGFFLFARWLAIPKYKGLYDWQKEHHELTWAPTYSMTLVPRDHGKTVEYVQTYQWAMQYQDIDVLLLGWTDRRKEAALYTYAFFYKNDLIEKDKRTSPFHFRIKNGGKFDCYLITSKETLGMHSEGDQNRFANITEDEWDEFKGMFNDFDENETITERELKAFIDKYQETKRKLWISIDDPIDISFMKERHKEESLELHHDSSLYPIHPFKWSYTGTHKFEGDFFDFLIDKYGDELVVYKRSTMLPNGIPLCPEKFTHPDLPTYDDDLVEGKLCLETIKKHVGPYAWYAEYEQDPHPITGDVWDHIATRDFVETPVHLKYDLMWISIDRATTTKRSSSLTGCLIGLRSMDNRQLLVTHDWTQHIELESLLIKLNNYVIKFHEQNKHMPIELIVEKQGGGDDFISMVKNRKDFLFEGKRIPNVLNKYCAIRAFHNIGEKIQRIRDRLYLPIINEQIQILSTLTNSPLWNQIMKFPYYGKIDAADALANAQFELDKIATQLPHDPMEMLLTAYQMYEDMKYGIGVKTPKEKEAEIRGLLKGGKRRNVFDEF